MADWYKIGTAPKKEVILVYGGRHFWDGLSCPTEGCEMNFVTVASWHDDQWQTGEDTWCEPTHWRAMPDPPVHDSDCATHNMPAMPNGPCDCSLSR